MPSRRASAVSLSIFMVLMIVPAPATGQWTPADDFQESLDAATAPEPTTLATPQPASVLAGEWRVAIDETWGEGVPTEQKLAIFDAFWTTVDEQFATFQGLDVDWSGLRARYRPEIAAGVSRGRFAAIMGQLSLALRESHTQAFDRVVSFSAPLPGIPLFTIAGWGRNHSGACMTAQDDGSALIYSVVPGHALGWRPGDRILGYDGRPWRELYRELLAAELPLRRTAWWGSSPSTFEHSLVMSAGMNWHLFATVDVARLAADGSVEIVQQPTVPLSPLRFGPDCSEQLAVPGVPKPLNTTTNPVSWGVVDGTRIGYVYVWGWVGDARTAFAHAIRELTQERETDGLIVDFRRNVGGSIFLADDGLDLMFRHPLHTIGFVARADPVDHLAMRITAPPGFYVLGLHERFFGEHPVVPDRASYDRPIAMLVGPGAVSAGDHVAMSLALHPRVRSFGKSTATAFNAPTPLDLGDADWSARFAFADAFRVGEPTEYLTHDEVIVDEPVWLRPEDVAQGKDTVVEAAIEWIRSQSP